MLTSWLPKFYVDVMRKLRTTTTPAAEKSARAELNGVIEEFCWFRPARLKRTLTVVEKGVSGVWHDIADRLDLRLAKVSA